MKEPIKATIDILKSRGSNLGYIAMLDTHTLELTITSNSVPITFTDPNFELHVKKHDGNFVRQTTDINLVEDKVVIDLWEQIITCEGITYCELLIKDNGRTTSSRFYFICRNTLDTEIINSVSDVKVLDDLDAWLEQSNVELELFREYVETLTDANINLESLIEIKDFINTNLSELTNQNIKANENSELLDTKNTETIKNIEDLSAINTTSVENIKNLDSKNTLVSNNIDALTSSNLTATENLNSLNDSIEEAKIIKETTEEIIESGGAATKLELEKANSQIDDIENELQEASIDMEKLPHNTIGERLKVEFANVFDKINKAETMEFEGSNLGAKTYDSYTKDMEISGRTYQNIFPPIERRNYASLSGVIENGYIKISAPDTAITQNAFLKKTSTPLIKPNTIYTLIVEVKENTLISSDKMSFRVASTHPDDCLNSNITINDGSVGIFKYLVTTKEVITDTMCPMRSFTSNAVTSGHIIFRAMLMNGDYTNKPIPKHYFNGVISVGEDDMIGSKYRVGTESIGKNLFDGQLVNAYVGGVNGTTFTGGDHTRCAITKCYKGIKYTCSKNAGNRNTLNFFVNYPKHGDNAVAKTSNSTMTSPIDGYLVYYVTTDATIAPENIPTEVQIEQSDNITPYEPYKRDYQYYLLDEPHMSTHETVSDTIDKNGILNKIVKDKIFKGSEYWSAITSSTQIDTLHFQTPHATSSRNLICDKFNNVTDLWTNDAEGIQFNSDKTYLQIRILRSKLETEDIEGFKKWLQSNNVKIYYAMQNPVTTNLKKKPILKTYEGNTYINSTNNVPSVIKCKMPVNVNAMLYDSIEENKVLKNNIQTLEIEKEELKEVNINQSLHLLELEDVTNFLIEDSLVKQLKEEK